MYQAALVLEGGAMRGQYTAGVLDALMAHHIQFKTVIGVSAGALCGTNYVSNQRGRTNDVNVNYRHEREYISVRRVFRHQDIINLNYLFAPHGENWADFDELAYIQSPMNFVVGATALATGREVYFERPQGQQLVATLKASSAMPFISKPQRTPQGLCLDGGIADSIPYKYAQVAGFDRIVVVRTRPRDYRKKPTSAVLRQGYQRAFGQYDTFVKTAIARPDMYNQQAAELTELERQGKVFVLAPQQAVTVKRLENDTRKLAALHNTGYRDTQSQLVALRNYLV